MTVFVDSPEAGRTIRVVVHNIAAHFELRFSSWFMATMMFFIGIVLTANPQALTGSPNAAIYFAYMDSIASPAVWRGVFLVIGTTRLMALVINGTFPAIWWTPHLRWVMSTVSSMVWAMVAISVVWTSYPTLGTIIYPGVFILELRNIVIARRDAAMAALHGGQIGEWS